MVFLRVFQMRIGLLHDMLYIFCDFDRRTHVYLFTPRWQYSVLYLVTVLFLIQVAEILRVY